MRTSITGYYAAVGTAYVALNGSMIARQHAQVLLIDDHQVTRSLLRKLLREAGFVQIREAGNATAGIAIAHHFYPDLICLDMHMPGESGLSMLPKLRAIVPAAAILMVTTDGDHETVESCLAAGANGFVLKPYNMTSLMDVVNKLLADIPDRQSPAE